MPRLFATSIRQTPQENLMHVKHTRAKDRRFEQGCVSVGLLLNRMRFKMCRDQFLSFMRRDYSWHRMGIILLGAELLN